MWSLARRSAWAHRAGLTGTALVLMLAGLLLAVAGVLAESGIRNSSDFDGPGSGLLLILAASFSGTVLMVVVMIAAATVTLALRGRRRELALLRAIGATRAQVRRQVGTEVLLVASVSTPFGAVAGVFLAGLLNPLLRDAGAINSSSALTMSPLPVVAAMTLLLPITWLASRIAARETLRVPPSQAVRSSTVETTSIGPVRRILAVAVGLFGLAAAFSPLAIPGTVGGASAATSAFLLVGAVALAGPLLIEWAFSRAADWERFLGPSGRLATANVRGFSRRLTIVVVPLALALTAGTAQTTVNRTVTQAAGVQIRDGVQSDLIATSATGLDQRTINSATSLPGVDGSTTLGSASARVLTDPDLDGVIDALAWEPTTVHSVSAGSRALLVDPDVSGGSLDALNEPNTIAISADATFGTGTSLGDSVALRWSDGTTTQPKVVAIYQRGLGFGDYLVDTRELNEHQQDSAVDTLLIDTRSGAESEVRFGLAELGIDTMSPSAYAKVATTASGAEQRLSAVLLLALLAFVFLAAANTLVMVTARRRPEFELYGRTGATRTQLITMAVIEASLTAALAWVIGTVAVAPAVLGVGFGMLGATVPPVDLTAYLGLSAAVLALPLLTVVPAVIKMVQPAQIR